MKEHNPQRLSPQDKQEQAQEFKELFNHPGWEWLELEIKQMYDNADAVVHSVNPDNRDFYAGKCAGLNELMALSKKFKDQFK